MRWSSFSCRIKSQARRTEAAVGPYFNLGYHTGLTGIPKLFYIETKCKFWNKNHPTCWNPMSNKESICFSFSRLLQQAWDRQRSYSMTCKSPQLHRVCKKKLVTGLFHCIKKENQLFFWPNIWQLCENVTGRLSNSICTS